MVYQTDGSDFRVSVDSGMPPLRLSYERGPRGARYQITAKLITGKIAVGERRETGKV